MLEVFLDALKDSAIVLAVAFVIHVLLSFFEDKIVHMFENHKKVSPLIGATAGLIPQCGISVVASELYLKEERLIRYSMKHNWSIVYPVKT